MPVFRRRLAVLAWVCMQPLAWVDDAHLSPLVRQLESLERQAAGHAARVAQSGGRYHFDYVRLHEDLGRIRNGVQDYLTPARAQPRDAAELHGDYRQELAEKDAP